MIVDDVVLESVDDESATKPEFGAVVDDAQHVVALADDDALVTAPVVELEGAGGERAGLGDDERGDVVNDTGLVGAVVGELEEDLGRARDVRGVGEDELVGHGPGAVVGD